MASADSGVGWPELKEWIFLVLTTITGILIGVFKGQANSIKKTQDETIKRLEDADVRLQEQISAFAERREDEAERLARVEENIRHAVASQARIETGLDRISDKLDHTLNECRKCKP